MIFLFLKNINNIAFIYNYQDFLSWENISCYMEKIALFMLNNSYGSNCVMKKHI